MAFTLKTNNLSGPSAVSPSGQLATAANFIDPYTYAIQYAPDMVPSLHLQKGKGKIMKFCQLVGAEQSYAADQTIHHEIGSLHEALEGVTVVGDVFTTATPHNFRVKDKVMISDGTIEKQAVVSAVNSATEFVGENVDTGAFGFGGAVTVGLLTNSWNKGEDNFTEGREDNYDQIINYTQIIKDFYTINESDMASVTWIEAPQYAGGEAWYSLELARTMDKYDNLLELTHLLNKRAVAGSAATTAGYGAGMKGVVQQIEERGNIANEYITDIEELSGIAFRIKQQGGTTAYTAWCDHTQMAHVRKMLSSVNAAFSGGANYGVFNNSKDMAISLDFSSVKIDGITFHFTPWTVLDDPDILGAAKFLQTAPACILVPAGEKSVMDQNGDAYDSPYLSLMYRRKGGLNRYKKTDFFGGSIGTPHKKDTMEMHVKTEQTNKVVGANQWFIVRRGTGIYTGS